MITTGYDMDFTINGPGYFVVRDPVTGFLSATRFGAFFRDVSGYLVTPTGMRLQGFADPALTIIDDLRFDSAGLESPGNEAACIFSIGIQTNGDLMVVLSDSPTSRVRGRILLQVFQNPAALTKSGDRLFSWTAAAGPLPQPVPPGTSGSGWLVTGSLEELVPKVELSRFTGPSPRFSQGILVPTGIPTDLGIQGGGFFVLRRTNDDALFATRAGTFYLDGSGILVHYSGMRLQGYADAALSTIGDLRIDTEGMPAASDPSAPVKWYNIDRLGVITAYLDDGTPFVRGQVLLAGCLKPGQLVRTDCDLYRIVTNSGLWAPVAPPCTGDRGWITEGALEVSQLDASLLSVRSNLNFFMQGPSVETGDPANLAISGPGFFTVRDPASGSFYATRCGGFQLDALGHLVTTNGLRLQGLTNADLTQSGDMTIDAAGAPDPNLKLVHFYLGNPGEVWIELSDGTTLFRGQVLLQDYRNLQALIPAGNGLYSNLTAALPLYTNGLAGYHQTGWIRSGALEQPSGMPAPIHLSTAGEFRLRVTDLPTGGAQLETSRDLLNWEVAGDLPGSELNEGEFFDSPEPTQKFYRVVVNYGSPVGGIHGLVPGVGLAAGRLHNARAGYLP